MKTNVQKSLTELGQNNWTLSDAEFQLSAFLEVSDSVHYLIHKNHPEKNFYSRNWEKLLGFSPASILDPLREKKNLVHIDFLKEYEQKWDEFEKNGNLLIKYQICEPHSGKVIWLEEKVSRKTNPHSNEVIWVGTIKDISGIEFYKEFIAESEKRFKTITDKLPVMVWISNEVDEIIYANDMALEFFTLAPEEKGSLTKFVPWIHPDYKDRIITEWVDKVAKRESINTELLLIRDTGQLAYLGLNATPRFMANGQFVGYAGAIYNLTKEYDTKQESKKAFAALKESEEQYRSLFENMELGILEVDKHENVVYTNKAFQKIVGYSMNEMQGKTASTLFLADGKSRKTMNAEHEKRNLGKGSAYEVNIKKKNGELAKLIISGTPLFDNQGNIKGSVGIHWDVTEIRKIEKALVSEKLKKEKELIEARHQAEDQQRSQIGRDLHDGVGQMLAYMGMYLGMIKSAGSLSTEEINELEKTLQNTLEQVRTLSRTLTSPALADLGLRDSVRELIASYAILKKPVFELSLYTQREDYNLNMEKKMVVYRILQELLNNTFKYAEAEMVVIRLYFEGKNFHMSYIDNGKGYDAHAISKGVGLDSMHSRIAYYKGSITLESTPGHGSKALITLPIG